LIVLGVLVVVLTARAAYAQAPAAEDPELRARAAFDQGVLFSQEERWAEALDAFRASRAIVERPSTLFNIATALQRLGRNHDAIDAVDAFLAVADPVRDGAQIDQAHALRAVLRESIAEITVRLRPGTAELSVDARATAARGEETDVRVLELDPGDHVLELRAPGYEARTVTLSIAPGERSEHEIALDRIPSTPAQLAVHASRSDAHIFVDEESVGTGAADVELATGTHVVRVEALEHRTFQRIVVLGPAEELEVEAPLERVSGGSILDEPAFWIVAGCILAAGAAAGIVGGVLAPSGSASSYGGSGGFTIAGLSW
jgi:hypothetical protein